MASRSSGSTVVRRRLGTALRALREEANVRVETAARELECSTAKISRLENGLGPAKKLEVRALLDLYGVVDDERRAQFDRWADGTKSVGWWESDADVVDDDVARLMAVETESVLTRIYGTPVIPSLLQNAEYNLAHLRELDPSLTDDEVHRLAELRQTRQRELLDPHNPLRLITVVDEAAVRRQVGSPGIHAAQLRWLADLLDDLTAAGRDDVDLRVLPFTAGTPDRAMSAFTLFTPREPDLDSVTAYVEDSAGASWYESTQDVQELSDLFDRIQMQSLDPPGSVALLRSAVTSGDDRSLPEHAP